MGQSFFSKFAEHMKLSGVQKTDWRNGAEMNFKKIYKEKCQILSLVNNSPRHQYALGAGLLESCPAEKNISALVDSKLIMDKKCVISAKKANSRITEWLRLQKTSKIVESILWPITTFVNWTLALRTPWLP